MSLFKNLLRASRPPLPPPPPVPGALPKITSPTAAEIARTAQPGPAAQLLLTPQQTPAGYLAALQEKQMGDEMVKTLAHGLPDREGVVWAVQSAATVADKLPETDLKALQAAQAWTANPTEANQAAAAAAAAKTDYRGPGAWAAQAAAWAKPDAPAGPRLAPFAVSAAVLLSSAVAANPKLAAPRSPSPVIPSSPKAELPAVSAPPAPPLPAPLAAAPPPVPPDVQAKIFQTQYPFIAMGLDLASGRATAG